MHALILMTATTAAGCPSQQDHDVYKQRLSAAGAPVKEAEKHEIHETKKPELHRCPIRRSFASAG